jgi:hypothetical protein
MACVRITVHNPFLCEKGPWGTLQCLNPYIRSEGFLLLSRINQTFMIFHNSAQKDKYFTSIRPNHLLRGSTCQNKILCSKSKVLGESPRKTQKAYFNLNVCQKHHFICYFWGGENVKKVVKIYEVKALSCIMCELDSVLTQELTR